MVDRKVYCEVIESVTFSDRCLFKLSKIIEANPTCENCLLRLFERMKSGKAERSGANEINMSNGIKATKATKVTKVIKVTNGPEGLSKRRRTKPMPKRKPRVIMDAPADAKQMYSTQDLSKLLGKSERRIQELAKEGKIPAQKVGMVWKFSREEMDRWLSGKKGCGDNVMTLSPHPDQDGQGFLKPQDI